MAPTRILCSSAQGPSDNDCTTAIMLKALGYGDAVIAFYNQKLDPDEHEYQAKCAPIEALDATLAGGFVAPGPQTLVVRNTINDFHRSKFLAVHNAIAKKLQEGRYGKPIKFDPVKNSIMEKAFADHAEMLQNGRESTLTARVVAFQYMAGLTVP